MGNILGEKKTVKQIIREQKRINNKSIRELDRELNRLRKEQKKAETEMKRLAKIGQTTAVKTLAKDIVRMKSTQTQFIKLKAELRSLSAAMDTMSATSQMQSAIRSVGRTMAMVSGQISLPELQSQLMKYQMEQEKMGMKTEMISEAMDDAMEHDSDEEDELVKQVMDEVGLDMDGRLVDAPLRSAATETAEEKKVDVDDDLEKRLAELGR